MYLDPESLLTESEYAETARLFLADILGSVHPYPQAQHRNRTENTFLGQAQALHALDSVHIHSSHSHRSRETGKQSGQVNKMLYFD